MPTRHSIATADAEVRDRIRLATGCLVKRLGLDEPKPPAFERHPELARIRELEAHADFLESLDGAIKGETAAPAKAAKATTKAKA